MFKIRFHLKNGPNFMKWQITNVNTGEKSYVDPSENNLICHGVILVNSKKTAQWIKKNNLKQVCAWISCNSYDVKPSTAPQGLNSEACYNPMVCDHWHLRGNTGANLDGVTMHKVLTHGRNVYF